MNHKYVNNNQSLLNDTTMKICRKHKITYSCNGVVLKLAVATNSKNDSYLNKKYVLDYKL